MEKGTEKTPWKGGKGQWVKERRGWEIVVSNLLPAEEDN